MRLCFVLSVVLVFNGCYGHQSLARGTSPKESSSIEYITTPSDHIIIPIMVHIDRALTSKVAREYKIKNRRKIKDLTRSILKEAESYLRHPSLNHSIRFSLIDTKFVRPEKLAMNDDGSVYLRDYCKRQGEKKMAAKTWWYSILLTGRDLFFLNRVGDKNWHTTGRSYMGGLCAIRKSCTVMELKPRNIGFLLAHEIGHSLGMNHDGAPYNDCKPHVNIMSNKYNPGFLPKIWSRCSRRQLEGFLESPKSWCLKKSYFQKLTGR